MQLKYYFFLVLVLTNFRSFAQHPEELIDGKILYDNIYNSAHKNIDSLQKINDNGTLFIKIDFLNGEMKNITFSSKSPAKLINVLQSTLEKSIVKINSNSLTSIIIPVLYNYKTSLSTKVIDLLNQIPEIDVNNLPQPNLENDYDRFLGIESRENKIIGISCVFLPWIKLSGKIE